MPRTSTGAGVTVTSRVLSILGSFDAEHPSLTLTEIAQRAGLTLPTAHRLAGELTAWGALRRTSRGRYVIGRRMWDLGPLAPVQTGLREVASPFLHDLYGATLATVHFAVRDGARALYLDCVSGHASVPVVSKAGSRLPLHSTGVGKVLLAHAPARLRHEVLAAPLHRFTPYTVIQPGRLASQLHRVAAGRLRHDRRGDDARGVLHRPARARRRAHRGVAWRGRPRSRSPHGPHAGDARGRPGHRAQPHSRLTSGQRKSFLAHLASPPYNRLMRTDEAVSNEEQRP